jgi:TPR repeat protein
VRKKRPAEIKPRDLPTIRELAVRVAQLDVLPAMVFLGKSLRETDLAASIQWYSMAADRGDIESLRALGLILSNRGGAGDDARALACFESAANKGDRLAKFLLGECYLFGKGVKPDGKRGTDLLREAADAGEAAAMDRLGICYQRGIGVEKDSAEAFRLFSLASGLNYYSATGNLGILYMTGDGVPQNKQKAISLFMEGSQAADNCMLFLAQAYESGSGVRPNQSKAAEWYQKAADAGNQTAADWCRAHNVKFTPKKPPAAGRRTDGS